MPREPQVLIYVGIKNTVVALDERTGAESWRAVLGGADFVTVLWDGAALVAANRGEVWRLEPTSGRVLWHNQLKGLGRGIVSLASARVVTPTGGSDLAVAKRRRDAQAAAAAGAAAGGAAAAG